MCGISGLVYFNNKIVESSALEKMNKALFHRGPDDGGVWIEENVGLGHRRLSIIDLSKKASQPMVGCGGRFALSYNGEIYNFQQLKEDLVGKGYSFKTNSDTEVLLNGWAEWGAELLQKINGMFAFAVYDRKTKEITLARDRYGIKPLYISVTKDRVLFASEQKALKSEPSSINLINKNALLEYFTFQNLLQNQTFYSDVEILPPGSFATIQTKSEKPGYKTHQYWDYIFQTTNQEVNKADLVEEGRHLFDTSVQRQLVSDVEVGSYLSGGMDSGSIVSIASRFNRNLKTFTCGFDVTSASGIERGFDERVAAEALSAEFKTEHYEVVLKSGDMERCIEEFAYHLEEPRVGQSYPNFYAAKLASKFVKVVLSGAGGDELFGGYPWRYYKNFPASTFEEYASSYYNFWQRLATEKELCELFRPVRKDIDFTAPSNVFRKILSKHESEKNTSEDYINLSLYFEAKTFLHGLLVVEDKLSMAHGLETRVPFLDNDLVDFAMKCPVKFKLNNLKKVVDINENSLQKKNKFFLKSNDGKQILRDMMASFVPKDVTEAIKKGFSSPDASWFKGESIEFVKAKLFDKNAKIYEILDYDCSRKIITEHIEGHKNRRLLVWSLLNVNEWMNLNIE